jgi:hypothetical protein
MTVFSLPSFEIANTNEEFSSKFRNCEQKAQKDLHPRAVVDLSY